MLFLILGLATSSTALEVVKIPMGMAVKEMTCEKAFESKVNFVENPNYETNSMEVWINAKYQGKTVFYHYCKDSLGNYFK